MYYNYQRRGHAHALARSCAEASTNEHICAIQQHGRTTRSDSDGMQSTHSTVKLSSLISYPSAHHTDICRSSSSPCPDSPFLAHVPPAPTELPHHTCLLFVLCCFCAAQPALRSSRLIPTPHRFPQISINSLPFPLSHTPNIHSETTNA